MNIILEDATINFYDEINNSDDEHEDKDNLCLLTNEPLDKNHIILPCNHKFNFFPLYKEVVNQKTITYTSHLNTDKLLISQIKCPYCRQICNNILPRIKVNNNIVFINGVNTPEIYSMPFHKCHYIFKSGKNKNNRCSKIGFYKDNICYCKEHHLLLNKRTETKNNLSLKPTCKSLLQSGKRKGEECGSSISIGEYCKRHIPK